MPLSAHHRLVALAALLALLVATPLAAMPAPAMVPAVAAPADCDDCPMMAARAQHDGPNHDAAPAAGDCHDEPATPNWDCCDVAAVPAVPLDEAAPTAPQTLAAPAAAAVAPAATLGAAPPTVEADDPDPPGPALFLLHSSYLN